jgi:hypothetical protein
VKIISAVGARWPPVDGYPGLRTSCGQLPQSRSPGQRLRCRSQRAPNMRCRSTIRAGRRRDNWTATEEHRGHTEWRTSRHRTRAPPKPHMEAPGRGYTGVWRVSCVPHQPKGPVGLPARGEESIYRKSGRVRPVVANMSTRPWRPHRIIQTAITRPLLSYIVWFRCKV